MGGESMNRTVAGSGQYIVLPPCVDENGHRFEVGPSRIVVCVRCGYIRSNP